MVTMYNGYDFVVEAVNPSGIISYQSNHATAVRKFLVPCKDAEELALRLLGKFYTSSYGGEEYTVPILPAPYPFSPAANKNYGHLNLVAVGFSIEPGPPCCFGVNYLNASEVETHVITDPTSLPQMERYWSELAGADNSECLCILNVQYEENPCDCVEWNANDLTWTADDEILPGTCVSVERNPAYEIFTLPNSNLVWKNILDGQGQQVQLKADSYAYKIIPKADIIAHWHNVPVSRLCEIETHLRGFRGTVNQEEWGSPLLCYDALLFPQSCSLYEPETILFIDFQEDRSRRTDAFGGNYPDVNMNTTTLKLIFKQKRVELEFGPSGSNASVSDDDTGIAGWNHLFNDSDTEPDAWMRVVIKSTQNPIFPLRAFRDIFYPS